MKQVHLFQPNYTFGGASTLRSDWIPYSVGCIWAYAQDQADIAEHYRLVKIHHTRADINSVVSSMDNPAVCGFSSYIWNLNYNLALAAAIKSQYPECTIVFGGPAVDEVGFNFYSRHRFVDSVVVGEGEKAFAELLRDRQISKVKPVYSLPRSDLDDFPSPYAAGLFDEMVASSPIMMAATIETNRGCPFACTFCDWGSATQSKIKKMPLTRVLHDIEWLGKHQVEYTYGGDANFGVFSERDLSIAQFMADTNQKYGFPKTFNVSFYKNSTLKILDIIEVLQSRDLCRGLTLSVQSNTDRVLDAIKRKNMEISKLSEIYQMCNSKNIPYYSEFILGLPEESFSSWTNGLCAALEAGCHSTVEVYSATLLPNSEMFSQREKYGIKTITLKTCPADDVSQVPEETAMVVSTNTMSVDDFIKSWMYGWMIINFHSYGWTQLYARYARSHKALSYQTIYNSLFEWLQNDAFLKKHFDQTKSIVSDSIANQRFDWRSKIQRANCDLHADRTQTQQSIATWARSELGLGSDPVFDSLVAAQDLFVVDPQSEAAVEQELQYPVFDLVDSSAEIKSKPTTYIACPTESWGNDPIRFNDYLVYRARTGFPKRLIQPIL